MQEITRCHGCMEEIRVELTCPHCGYEEGQVPESALHLSPGTILQEKYLIGRALGQGGFGITYLAYDLNLNIKLAIKEYLPQELAYRTGGQIEISIYKKSLADNFNYGLNKYLGEARTLARFNEHPNIVSVRDFFKANGTAYIVMSYIEGITLKEYLGSRQEPLSFEEALNIFMPVLDALKEVHAAGILHRDISPDNLLIDAKGRVVLIDFGAARQAMGDKSRSMSVVMKAGYSPEEQYRSRGEQGPWTDIYAVSTTLYDAVTGVTPPESLDRLADDTLVFPSQLGIKIEPYQEQALLKALAVRARDRFQTVEEFQEALLGKKQPEKKKALESLKKMAGKPGREYVEHEDIKKCPFCSEQIKASAIVCRYCKMNVQEDLPKARKRQGKSRKAENKPLNKQSTKVKEYPTKQRHNRSKPGKMAGSVKSDAWRKYNEVTESKKEKAGVLTSKSTNNMPVERPSSIVFPMLSFILGFMAYVYIALFPYLTTNTVITVIFFYIGPILIGIHTGLVSVLTINNYKYLGAVGIALSLLSLFLGILG